ncbi:hypothetical protein Ddye_006377 [Dipteronia dyeriana]|uniref:RNase H type-1 domain-containing protein n=1 Tax=Dipteronia dyeriana TaxID=168575 RepID=A0AAE0CQM0_9ROSI|nr:hypothetical protein Ddye_006377 [Dipteronia dyeriana]
MVKASDTVKFCVALWFKNHGSSYDMDLTLLILDLKDRCVDSCSAKKFKGKVWNLLPYSNFSFFVDGSSKARTAEVLALHRACQLIVDNQLLVDHNIDIYSDSSLVVSWCNGDDFGNFSLVIFAYDIKQILHLREGLTIKFVLKRENWMADCLAKIGSSRGVDRLVWSDFG